MSREALRAVNKGKINPLFLKGKIKQWCTSFLFHSLFAHEDCIDKTREEHFNSFEFKLLSFIIHLDITLNISC